MSTLEHIAATPISRLMPLRPIRVQPECTVGEAVAVMQEHHCGATLVCDAEGRIQGIFTERDLLLQSDRYQPGWLDLPVVQVMTEGPVTANVSSTVRQVVELMRSGGYRHVPVVDDKGRPRGIVSVRDVLTFVAEHFPEECLNLPPDPSLETRGLYGG